MGCCGEVRASPACCARVPLRFAKGGEMACFVFPWFPADAGMTWGEWGWGGVSRAIWGLDVVLCGVLRGFWACR